MTLNIYCKKVTECFLFGIVYLQNKPYSPLQEISSNIMKSPSPKCYMIFWDMTIYNDTFNWSDITPICELIAELDFITNFDLITKFWRFP